MTNRLDLKDEYIELIKSMVKSVFDDVDIYIFGSRVQGLALKYSDVDIALKGNQKLDILKILTLKSKFHDSLFPYKVDIIDYNSVDENFLNIIKSDLVKI